MSSGVDNRMTESGWTRREFRQSLNWLFTFVRPHLRQALVLMLMSACTSILVLLQPFLTKLLIDDGLLGKNFELLLIVAILIFVVGVLSTIMAGLNRYLHTRLSGRVLFNLRETVYRHLLNLSPTFHGRHRSGDILSRLDGDVAEIQRFAVDGLFGAVSGILGLTGALLFMLWLNWQLSLVVVFLIPVEWYYLRYMRPKVQAQTRKMRERSADISSFMLETLPVIKFIQGMSTEDQEAGRLNRLNHFYLGDLLRLQIVEFTTSVVPQVLTSASRTLVFIVGGYWVIEGSFALGSLIAFSTYLGMAVGPVQTLLGLYVAMQRAEVSLGRVQTLMLAAPDVDQNKGKKINKRLQGEIVFDNVSFGYADSERMILQHASVRIEAGSKVGLYGPSGIGKSTFVDLMMRYFDPDSGRILIDGEPLKDLMPSDWRRSVAYVAQDTVIFRGSIIDNIRYALPDASEKALKEVIRLANLTEMINAFPQGENTPVGERGSTLSGGEKQRIAIARALLRKPSLLIFDEATSAVDLALEQAMMSEIDRLFSATTRLIISHRESPMINADALLTIVDGQLLMQTTNSSN